MSEALKLGVATKIITPEVGACLCGYQPNIVSKAVNDDLTATVFVFKQGDVSALMISFTLSGVHETIVDTIREKTEKTYGIPKNHCLIHSIHTHSGPNLLGGIGWGDIDEGYLNKIFYPAVWGVIDEAMNNMTEVKMGVASGNSYVGINRRELTIDNKIDFGQNPWGVFNPEMTVISFKDNDNNIVANMVHYGCHPTSAGMNYEISRDWPGVMIDVLSEISGGQTAFFNGPEGDVGPRITNGLTVGEGNIHFAMELGGVAAQDAVRIYRDIRGYHEAKLDVVADTIDLPLSPLLDYESAKENYEKLKHETMNVGKKRATYYRHIMELYESGYVNKESRTVDQTIIRIGDVAFVGFAYELFSEIGMRIAQKSNVPRTLSLALTNGSQGYFATEDQICRGGYEVEMFKSSYIQPYADNADWHMVTETLKNLNKLDNKGD